ncbi:MAG: chemotaxis-specific protein-glutamate methyltransferase CheB [Deltaproteobacteria bacterium]|nr:MAG: chemotaxis-specific protein-glutamate methyltransferase CheB [Deltaproteobacteria bacterium]
MTSTVKAQRPLRVVVVDDSAYNRQTITSIIEELEGVCVVGRAMNGKEALRMVFDLEPDVVTLDLEMPEMDGFAFLRLLMGKRPTPVIVVSGFSGRENVFRALELGALDFIAKPSRDIGPDLRSIGDEIKAKIGMVRRLQAIRLQQRAFDLLEQKVARGTTTSAGARRPARTPRPGPERGAPARNLVVVGSSTGGPPALQLLLGKLPQAMKAAVVVAQHMPPRFTAAFAERLDRVLDVRVKEAEDGEALLEGTVYIAPGGHNVEVFGAPGAGRVRVAPRQSGAVVAPSADLLFETAAASFGPRTCAVVLTGMGSDGSVGIRSVVAGGGTAYAEDPQTAVMPGMPSSACATGLVERAAPVDRLGEIVEAWLERT